MNVRPLHSRGMGILPMCCGTPRCSVCTQAEIIKSAAILNRVSKERFALADCPEYRPTPRSTAADGQDVHATLRPNPFRLAERPMKNIELFRLASLLLAIGMLAGCGYSRPGDYDHPTKSGYQWHSLYREDVQTVAVPIFTNREYRRGVEFSLSKAVINQLEAHSPYKVVLRRAGRHGA